MEKLLIGTRNKGKVTELIDLLDGLQFKIVDLNDFEDINEPVESGSTFEKNAEIKATAYARGASCYTVADDSGLEVAALNNRPGVHSARFAGLHATEQENNKKLVEELLKSKSDDYSARFVCAMSLASPSGEILFTTTAVCKGVITVKPHGHNGFGYDPHFSPLGYQATFGQLSSTLKRKLSHRAKAAKKMTKFLSSQFGLLT